MNAVHILAVALVVVAAIGLPAAYAFGKRMEDAQVHQQLQQAYQAVKGWRDQSVPKTLVLRELLRIDDDLRTDP